MAEYWESNKYSLRFALPPAENIHIQNFGAPIRLHGYETPQISSLQVWEWYNHLMYSCKACGEREACEHYNLTTEMPSALTSNSSATCSIVPHISLSSTVYSSHTNGEHGAIAQVIQLVVTPFCIVLNNPRLCTVILRRIVHLFMVEGGREGERESISQLTI